MAGRDGGERLPVPERVGEEEAVGLGDVRVAAGAVDGDGDGGDVGDVVGRVGVGGLQPVDGGEVVVQAGDAEVGLARGDLVREGGGEVGGGGVGGAREALAGEGDVDAVPGGDEVEVGPPGVVRDEEAVVVPEAEELPDGGHVLALFDVVGAQRQVAAPAAAVPRGGGCGGGEEEEERQEEYSRRRKSHGGGGLARAEP